MPRSRSIELASLFVTRSDEEFFLLDSVDSWAGHVNRFVKEASGSAPLGSTPWGAYDWIAALHLRDHLRRALSELEIVEPLATIEVTDELFRRFTVPDESGLLRLSGMDDLPSEPWWWHRVPSAGPAADEFAEWLRIEQARL